MKALPKLAKGAKNAKLKQLFSTHLEETKGQVERIKKLFLELGEKTTGQHCNGMEGVIEEGKDALDKDEEGTSFDSGVGVGRIELTRIGKDRGKRLMLGSPVRNQHVSSEQQTDKPGSQTEDQ